jgi:hypothetical protein
MEFVDKIREKVVDGRVLLRAETKKKEGGKFEGLACWRVPPQDKEHWKRIGKIVEPKWMVAK